MSALAMILAKNGYSISGSDNNKNSIVKISKQSSIKIFQTQEGLNIDKIFKEKNKNILVVVTSAIRADNLELQKAKKLNLPIKHRSDILKLLINEKESIVISGSHGKTTTSTYITTILSISKKDHTAIIGGIVPLYNSNYNISNSELLVAEADESDGSLVKFNPNIGVITNIELEHIDYYKNLEHLIKTIKKFAKNCTYLIANFDCQNIRNNLKPTKWFSTQQIDKIDFSLIPKESNGCEIIAAYYEEGKFIDMIKVPIPGIHNLSNTIAGIASCRTAGLSFKEIKKGIDHIQLPGRRFEYKGLWKNRFIFEDYAHHPSEIDAAISTAYIIINSKNNFSDISPKRVVTIFQPHRFSRTKRFKKEFAESLSNSDVVFITPIYSAGEDEIEGTNHRSIEYELRKLKSNLEIYSPENNQELKQLLTEKTIEKDLILILGAGDINFICANLFLEVINNKSIKNNLAA